jgi:hypothetical protein
MQHTESLLVAIKERPDRVRSEQSSCQVERKCDAVRVVRLCDTSKVRSTVGSAEYGVNHLRRCRAGLRDVRRYIL